MAWRFELASSMSGSGDGANDLDGFVVNVVIVALLFVLSRLFFCVIAELIEQKKKIVLHNAAYPLRICDSTMAYN